MPSGALPGGKPLSATVGSKPFAAQNSHAWDKATVSRIPRTLLEFIRSLKLKVPANLKQVALRPVPIFKLVDETRVEIEMAFPHHRRVSHDRTYTESLTDKTV